MDDENDYFDDEASEELEDMESGEELEDDEDEAGTGTYQDNRGSRFSDFQNRNQDLINKLKELKNNRATNAANSKASSQLGKNAASKASENAGTKAVESASGKAAEAGAKGISSAAESASAASEAAASGAAASGAAASGAAASGAATSGVAASGAAASGAAASGAVASGAAASGAATSGAAASGAAAAGSAAGGAGLGTVLFWIIVVIVALVALAGLIAFFIFEFENMFGGSSTLYGAPEVTSSEDYDPETYVKDGLATDMKYAYAKTTCDLDNYKESECLCEPGEEDCRYLGHEEMIKVLKNDDKCKIGNSWFEFWDSASLWFTGGQYTSECQFLRQLMADISYYEYKYSAYDLKVDRGLILATILSVYDNQYQEIGSNTEGINVQGVNHYEIIKDIVNTGLLDKSEVDNIIKSTIIEDVYPYYTYENGSCVLHSHKGVKFSLEKWQLYMRYGYDYSILGVNNNNFSLPGYVYLNGSPILGNDITGDDVTNLTGTGWAYTNALNNAWNQSSEECRSEEFFTSRSMYGPIDTTAYTKKIENIESPQLEILGSANVISNFNGLSNNINVNLDYKAGFVYNKTTVFKKAINEGKSTYDEALTPKLIEQLIMNMIDRKTQLNSSLYFYDNKAYYFGMQAAYGNSEAFFWPIGSNTITEVDGVELAVDKPAHTYISSKYGMRDHPIDGEYKMHTGIDIPGIEGKANVIAAKRGKVVKIYDKCIPGNKGCGGGLGNYIKISHEDGTYSVYAHLYQGSIKVSVNDIVHQGQVIAKVGNTGNSTGPHLHFEVRTDSTTTVDPLNYVDPKNPRPQNSQNIMFVQGNDNKQTVCKTLLATGFSKNATAGIMANVEYESGFRLDNLGDEGTSNGLFQWHATRLDSLKNYCKDEYLTSINCQLDFFLQELKTRNEYNYMMAEHSAYDMAYQFCDRFERPAARPQSCINRGNTANEKYVSYVEKGCEE